MAGSLVNPINLMGGGTAGALAALATPTESLEEQSKRDAGGIKQVLKDILIPGYGPYNSMKRVGTSIRGPELEALKAELESKKGPSEEKDKEEKDTDKKDDEE